MIIIEPAQTNTDTHSNDVERQRAFTRAMRDVTEMVIHHRQIGKSVTATTDFILHNESPTAGTIVWGDESSFYKWDDIPNNRHERRKELKLARMKKKKKEVKPQKGKFARGIVSWKEM